MPKQANLQSLAVPTTLVDTWNLSPRGEERSDSASKQHVSRESDDAKTKILR